MKYYKAIDYIDKVFPKGKGLALVKFVKNELFTEKELKRYCDRFGLNFERVCAYCFVMCEISKKKTHWLFGCRFADFDEI